MMARSAAGRRLDWVRQNLFRSPVDSALSLTVIAVGLWLVALFIQWAVLHAVWNASSFDECREIIAAAHGEHARGACWAVLKGRLGPFIYGFYPEELSWRPATAMGLLVVVMLPLLIRALPRWMLWAWAAYPFVAFELVFGGAILEPVESNRFGGLVLVLAVSVGGIPLAIAGGVVLALGRTYLFLPLRVVFAAFLAVFRGVPLLVLLLAAAVLLSYMLPPGIHFDIILRMVLIAGLHASVTIADAIRSALVSLPAGQWDAARALGFGRLKAFLLVILPQVLSAAAPAILHSSAGLVRDTTLVLVIGLFDPIMLANTVRANADWNGIWLELYLVVGGTYGLLSFLLTRAAVRAERRLLARGLQPPVLH